MANTGSDNDASQLQKLQTRPTVIDDQDAHQRDRGIDDPINIDMTVHEIGCSSSSCLYHRWRPESGVIGGRGPGFMIRLVLRRRSLPSQLSGLPLVVACLGAMLVASPPGASTLGPGPPATDVADGRRVKGLRKATAPQGRPLTR
jgi:hypothetical protein